jgi:hypothetical protein
MFIWKSLEVEQWHGLLLCIKPTTAKVNLLIVSQMSKNFSNVTQDRTLPES